MVFDAESKSVLHTEMAKKNLFVKRGEFPFIKFRYLDLCANKATVSCILLQVCVHFRLSRIYIY